MRERTLLPVVLVLLLGGGARADPRDECLVGLDVDGPPVIGDAHPFRVTCADCDPRCDHDGLATPNGTCTFALRACVNQVADPACVPAGVRRVRVRPRRVALSLPPLPSDTTPSCGSSWTTFDVPVTEPGRRLLVAARARAGARRRRDTDRYAFTCTPRAPGEVCPSAAPICGDGVITAAEECDPGATPDGCADGTICRTGGDDACRCTPCDAAGPSTHTLVLTTTGGPPACDHRLPGSPSAGDVRSADEHVLADLTPSCFYAGGPYGTLTARAEAGASRALTVVAPAGCLAGRATIGPSSASGGLLAAGCTEPGCSFTAPLPVFNTALSSCIVPRIAETIRGTLDVDRGDLVLDVPLALDVYLTTAEIHPCPVCAGGTCQGGGADGVVCTPSDPFSCPVGGTLLGTIPLTLPLATVANTRQASDGVFCTGQPAAGALGHATARRISVQGAGLAGPLPVGTPFDLVLAGQLCVPASGVPILDGTSGLPGPAVLALPVRGRLD